MKDIREACAASSSASAQMQPPPKRPQYEISKEQTLQGTVTAVDSMAAGPGKFATLTVQTGETTAKIVLCPEFVLQEKKIVYTPGDKVTVLCAPSESNFRARQVTRGGDVLTLLDENGKPNRKPMAYDLAKEVELNGKIASVNRHEMRPGKTMISITLATGGEEKEIMLGPDFVVANELNLATGDAVTVRCAPFGPRCKARQITRGSEVANYPTKRPEPPASQHQPEAAHR